MKTDAMLKNKYFLTGMGLVFLFLTLVFVAAVYHYIDMEIYSHIHTTPKKYLREIDTFPKEWLNGYMGTFFRFKYFGNLIWLTVPLVGLYFLVARKPRRWQMALLFVTVAVAVIVGIKGFKNYRYQLTMIPFLLSILMMTGWELSRECSRLFKGILLSLAALFSLFNIYNYYNQFSFFWNYKVTAGEDRYPHQIMRILGENDARTPEEKVMVCMQPLYYYHFDSRAFYYSDPAVSMIFDPAGDRYRLWDLLRRQLKIKYIFYDYRIMALLKDRIFGELVDVEGDVLSEKRYRLCRLRDRPFTEEIPDRAIRSFNLWNHRSESPTMASPRLQVFEATGEFSLDYHRHREKNILTVKNSVPAADGRREVRLGYRLDLADIRKMIPKGEELFLFLLVEAKVSKTLVNRDNEIFISDFDGHWDKAQVYFATPRWRSYLVRKKIRPGISQLEAGFGFKLRANDDAVDIRNVSAYFTRGDV